MNKTAQTQLHRLFLIDALPDPLTPASRHLQIFDNYIENTRLRLRLVREPSSNSWTRILQQRFAYQDSGFAITKLAEIYLNEPEYGAFEKFRGREIRKNRYFHEFDNVIIAFDIFLGALRGLNTARVDFETQEEMLVYEPPPFAQFEITNDEFFLGENLVKSLFADVQIAVSKINLTSFT